MTLLTNFKKDSSSRKTPDYKTKKLKELKTEWGRFVELDEQLMALVIGQPDAGYENQKQLVEAAYAKLHESLMLLSDEISNEEETDEEQTSEQEHELRKLIAKQEIRFEGINRILDEIDYMIDQNQPLSKAFCKIKSKLLNAYWDRI